MKGNIMKYEIYVDGKLRFIKNSINDKNFIVNLLKKKEMNYNVKEIKLY